MSKTISVRKHPGIAKWHIFISRNIHEYKIEISCNSTESVDVWGKLIFIIGLT
jgi:hypothetical protein